MAKTESNMRLSCQILRQIESLKGEATTKIIHGMLPEIDKQTISSIIVGLRRQGRVFVNGEVNDGKRGRRFKFMVNPDWERPAGDNATISKGSPLSGKKLTRYLGVVEHKDEKVKLIKRYMFHAAGADHALMISMLEDYGVKYTPEY